MKMPSFRFKIALLSAAIAGLVLVLFGILALWVIKDQKTETLDTRIRSLGGRQPGWLSQRQDFQRFEQSLSCVFGEGGEGSPFILQVRAADGTRLHQSGGWPEDLPESALKRPLRDAPADDRNESTADDAESSPGRGWGGRGRGMGPGGGQAMRFTKIPEFMTLQTQDRSWRVGRLGGDDFTLIIGLDATPTLAEIRQLQIAFLLALPVALGLVGIGGWIVAGRALRPLRMISETAADVTSAGLDRRIPVSNEDPEIRRLIDTLNEMMDRLERSFRQATRFSADASHELKTPIAIMRGELENALHDAAPGSREQKLLGSLLDETQRLAGITRSLLLLSRADAGQLVPAIEEIDLSRMLPELLEDTEVLAASAEIELQAQITPGIRVMADPLLLRSALLNVLTNAVKYNEPGGFIHVDLQADGHEAQIRIANSGPGIPAEEQALIFDRFQRADRSRERRIDGIGLGLSLTREILHAHQGGVELGESRPGLTRFVIRLPVK
jgi:heavy metal sensor kinase